VTVTDGFPLRSSSDGPTVTFESPAHLRLHVEELPDEGPVLELPQLGPLVAAFEQATGWLLRYQQSPSGLGEVWSTTIENGRGQSAGRLVLAGPAPAGDEEAGRQTVDLRLARPLALALGSLLSEIHRLRCAVWQREAELAAGVPITARTSGEPHLAERLEAVLKGGAEAVGCPAAGLYLLDESTSELKLRVGFGLPPERLLAPARPLRGAVADLEALVGHAVVLEDTSVLPHWRCPEDFPAAVCVPVASPSIPLGTLWLFCDRPRDFSPQETNLIEIIAGRLAAELEREVLLAAGADAKRSEQQLAAAARWLSDRLPSIAPLLDDYEVAGWTQQAAGVGGDFHDWSVLPDGRLALAVGDAEGSGCEAALSAASLHAALKAHSSYGHGAHELLRRVNETLLAASPGDQRASLVYAVLESERGHVEWALAGSVGAILVRAEDRWIDIPDSPPIGADPETLFCASEAQLLPGDVLLLVSGGVRAARDGAGLLIGENALASLVARHLRDSAERLAARLRKLLDSGEPAADLSLLILKRRQA
jgi:sigma-B regulation protein RsbU (phosphoserine phosphatase)